MNGYDNDLYRHQVEHLIDELIIGRHGERNRQIMKRKLIDGICFEPLAEEFKLSVRQVKYIVHNGEKKIFSHMDK